MLEPLFLLFSFFLLLYAASVITHRAFIAPAIYGMSFAETSYTCIRKSLGIVEHWLYRLLPCFRVEMTWKQYALASLIFHATGVILLYTLCRFQYIFGLGPYVEPLLSLNIAISFLTGTDWQAYVPEKSLCPILQTIGLITAMFLSTASGMSTAFAALRAFKRKESSPHIGNFFQDLFRGIFYVLIPLSIIGSLILSLSGVPSDLPIYAPIYGDSTGEVVHALHGPIAAYTAIELLGTNGGGFYNANMAHPVQNPTIISHIAGLFMMLLLPSSLIISLGESIGNTKAAKLIYISFAIFFSFSVLCMAYCEGHTSSQTTLSNWLIYSNIEGKELRIGTFWSAFWAVASTVTTCGASAFSFGSFTPSSISVPLLLMQTGEVVFGGVGFGLMGIIFYLVLAAFTSGLMIGRTPEIFGKKIDEREIFLIILFLAVPLILTLGGTVLFSYNNELLHQNTSSTLRSLTELLYGMTSCASTNGSVIYSLNISHPAFLMVSILFMWIARLVQIIIYTAFIGVFSEKRPSSVGFPSLKIESVVFLMWFMLIIIGVGLLSYFPALVIGPLFEQFHAS